MIRGPANRQRRSADFADDSAEISMESGANCRVYGCPAIFCAEDDVREEIGECLRHVSFALSGPGIGAMLTQGLRPGLPSIALSGLESPVVCCRTLLV